jgi:hypothetical protein
MGMIGRLESWANLGTGKRRRLGGHSAKRGDKYDMTLVGIRKKF